MNTIKTMREHFEALPADLSELFARNFNKYHKGEMRQFWEMTGNHSDLIYGAFTWSQTPQGDRFWEMIGTATSLADLERAKSLLKKTGRYHFEAMSEVRQLIFKNTCSESRFNTLMKAEISNFRHMIDKAFTWSDTDQGHGYWTEVAENIETDRTKRIEAEYMEEVETITGEMVRKMMAVKLNERIYGADKYAARGETAYTTAIENGIRFDAHVLKSETFKALDTHNSAMIFHDSMKSICIEFEGLYFISKEAAIHGGVLCINDTYIRANQEIHAYDLTKRKYVEISALRSDFVFVNQTTWNEINIYAPADFDYVYKCDIKNQYYLETQTGAPKRLLFVDAGGVRTRLMVNPHNTSGLYNGQYLRPISLEIETGAQVLYASIDSAKNDGLILTICPHCDTAQSQYHDLVRCKRDNFKNLRYDYHSQKPKRSYTNAEFKIGVEIEKESFDGASHSHRDIYNRFGWVKERDGSLDGRIGYELVSPAYNLFSNKMVKEAEAIEAHFPALINGEASSACGGHIHFSRKHTSGRDTLEMYCGYLPLLYAIYKGRTKQSYSHAQEKEALKNSDSKYQAVRILRDRIEFRIFPAVKNLKSLKWRIELLRYMAKNPTASPLKVVNDLCDKRTALFKLFNQIFSEQTIYKRALDTLTMAKQYDQNYYNIDFTAERQQINSKAKRNAKK